jgi:hypothetical protein
VAFWRFDEADEHYLFEVKRAHRLCRSRQLAFTTVDEDKLRQGFFLLLLAPVSAKNCLVHRGKIIRAFDRANDKTPVFSSSRLAVLEDNDARDVL